MFNWIQGAVASVAGTAEPEYGSEAIHSVAKQAGTTPFTLLSKQDQKWLTPSTSFVETQTFYIYSDAGTLGFVQVIYSNVAIAATVQFTTQIYYLEGDKPAVWCSDPVSEYEIDDDRFDLISEKCAVTLNADGDEYSIKSTTSSRAIVNVTFKKIAPGFVVGKNGTTTYGTDPKQPWGSMRHSFWPKCDVKGSIVVDGAELNVQGKGVYIHALQGMKPHHCAARWNFVSFQSPSYSAVMMEYTTPPSYANTVVNVNGISSANEILLAGAEGTCTHTDIKGDPEVNWPEPAAVKYAFKGKDANGKTVEAVIEGPLGKRLDRVDVMGELPGFVKQLASAAVGTRPYIYQYGTKATLKFLKDDGSVDKEEDGLIFAEATFIS